MSNSKALKLILPALILVIVVIVVVSRPKPTHPGNDNPTTVPADQSDTTSSTPVEIAALLPLTGNTAFLGEMCKNAMDIAVEEVNSAGGVQGRPLAIEYEDNKNEVKEGIALFQQMKARGRNIIISSMSSLTKAIKPLLTDSDVLLFATMVSTHNITEGSPNLFRLFVNAGIDATHMANFASKELKAKQVVIIAVNDEMGKSFSHVFTNSFTSNGGSITRAEYFDKSSKDFRDIIQTVKGANFDAIYLLGYDANLGALAAQIREAGIEKPLLSIGTIAQENVRKTAGEAVEGAYYTSINYDPAKVEDSSPAAVFVNAYETKFGKKPTYFSAFAYDTVHLIAKSMNSHGLRPKQVSAGLLAIDSHVGAVGKISIPDNRDAAFEMTVRRIKQASNPE